METLRRIMHWFASTFEDACPDPQCPGKMQVYDNNVNWDTCDVYARNYRMHEEGWPPGKNAVLRGYPAGRKLEF